MIRLAIGLTIVCVGMVLALFIAALGQRKPWKALTAALHTQTKERDSPRLRLTW